MRFLHTADWHIGRKLHGYDLLDDQQKIFSDILEIAQREQVDAIVIAGDLYDRSVPSTEAVALLNQQMAEMNLVNKFPILAISGNHDSSTRLETGTPWFQATQYFLHIKLEQAFTPVTLGDVEFFLLPYFEPIEARLHFKNDEIKTIQDAMPLIIEKMQTSFSPDKQHVLVGHFFAAGSSRSDSETKVEVGGLDSIPTDILTVFDYVALGHLHGKDALQHPTIRYSGSPLKFSLSEKNQQKGVWIVEMAAEVQRTFQPLTPLYDLETLTESFQTLVDPAFYHEINRDNYLHVMLTDRGIIPNMMNQLRQIYPRILAVERLHGREMTENPIDNREIRQLGPEALLGQFFEEMTDQDLSLRQKQWLQGSIQEVEGADK